MNVTLESINRTVTTINKYAIYLYIMCRKKWEKLCCLPLNNMNGSEKNRFLVRLKWLWKEPVVWLDHSRPFCLMMMMMMIVGVRSDVPLPLHMDATVFATDQWLRRWCPEEYGPKCQWAFALALQRRVSVFIARQHTDARYWYSKSVPLSVCLSVRPSVCSSVTFRYQMKTA